MTILQSTAKEMEGSTNGNFLERVLFRACFFDNHNFHNKAVDSKLIKTPDIIPMIKPRTNTILSL